MTDIEHWLRHILNTHSVLTAESTSVFSDCYHYTGTQFNFCHMSAIRIKSRTLILTWCFLNHEGGPGMHAVNLPVMHVELLLHIQGSLAKLSSQCLSWLWFTGFVFFQVSISN
jgi:hypothetical protein